MNPRHHTSRRSVMPFALLLGIVVLLLLAALSAPARDIRAGIPTSRISGDAPAQETPDPTETPTNTPTVDPGISPTAPSTGTPDGTPTPGRATLYLPMMLDSAEIAEGYKPPAMSPTPSGTPTPEGTGTPDATTTPDGTTTPDVTVTPDQETPTPSPSPTPTPNPIHLPILGSARHVSAPITTRPWTI